MSKILIVYGSTTGNTEWVANELATLFEKNDHEVSVENVTSTQVKGLTDGYDVILFGCSTWGDDKIEFQDDFGDFYKDIDALNVKGKKAAVFGCGDEDYLHFCGAVDVINDKLKELGAEITAPVLKINGDPDQVIDEIQNWAENINNNI